MTIAEHIEALSVLTLNPSACQNAVMYVAGLDQKGREELIRIADSHHVVVRALTSLEATANQIGNLELRQWARQNLDVQNSRIDSELQGLDTLCRVLESNGCAVTVLKSLDHWPDMGNDLDCYTSASLDAVARVLTAELQAQLLPRSWGDRLSQKMSFVVPGLDKTVEMHSERLGQTGEHVLLASRFEKRRVTKQVKGYTFRVPAPEERVIAATLQRMYRHLFFRVCDIANTTSLLEADAVNYRELHAAAELGRIWPGVATYLNIVSGYVRQCCGAEIQLPPEIEQAALFGPEKLFVRGRFLRLPVLPNGAGLYARQVASTLLGGDLRAAGRLTLLPPLASAAAVAFKVTGSNQGIW